MKTPLAILMMGLFSLSACQSVDRGSGCPPLIEYSADTQKRAAKELRALPKDSEVAKLVGDYGKMRRACRQ